MEEKIDWHSGKIRRLFKKVCLVCNIDFWVPKHVFDRSIYCSVKCASQARHKRVELQCAECGNTIFRSISKLAKSKSGFVFCSRVCKEVAQRTEGVIAVHPEYYHNHHRAYLIRTRGHRCERCQLEEWLGQPITLERHHIDGNSTNNSEDNLKLLCPNCHSQTPTYCCRNFGNGRKSRKVNKPVIDPYAEKGNWPSKEELAILLWKKPLEALAVDIGVTSTMVRRRAIRLGLPRPERGYWIRRYWERKRGGQDQ